MANGKYKEFQALLRKGIGTRSQKEFAEQVGIATAHLSRMLNNKEIPCPAKSTLIRIAKNTPAVSLNDFLASCGYDVMSIEERVSEMENAILEGVEAGKGRLWATMEDFQQSLQLLYFTEDGKFREKTEEKETVAIPEAEMEMDVSVGWGDAEYAFRTNFTLYYAKTQKNRIIVIGSSLTDKADEETNWTPSKLQIGADILEKRYQHTIIRRFKDRDKVKDIVTNHTAEERLLEAIFGGSGSELSVLAGYGFYLNEIPKGFIDFLLNHAGAFCTGTKETELYQKFLVENDPDVFASYWYENGMAEGVGAVVAKIISMETSMDFRYHDSYGETDYDDSCVMVLSPDFGDGNIPKELLIKLYEYAKELQLPTFGMCYFHQPVFIKKTQQFETDKFYLQF